MTIITARSDIEQCNHTLLQTIPRNLNREVLGFDDNNLPFHGADIWNLYELSWLNINGLPEVAVGQLTLSANSKNVIESKSLKLYLNSFNQTIFSTCTEVNQIIERDIRRYAEGEAKIILLQLKEIEGQILANFKGDMIDNQDIVIKDYNLNPKYLDGVISKEIVQETLVSNLLKSNCPITKQPDWGSIMIQYKGNRIDRKGLLKYIVSFRKHNGLHEQCVEHIFRDIWHFCQPKELTVYARYTRRGGIDINPWRSNVDFTPCCSRLIRQ